MLHWRQGARSLAQGALAAASLHQPAACHAAPALSFGHLWSGLHTQGSSLLQAGGDATSAATARGFASSAPFCPQCGSPAHQHHAQHHATTILCIRKDGQVVMVGDGQVSTGSIVAKPNARKIRRIPSGGTVVAGFAGSAADGLSLLERLETKLEEHPEQLLRSAVELAKQWRQDKALRFLQAELLVADAHTTLTVSGGGSKAAGNNIGWVSQVTRT